MAFVVCTDKDGLHFIKHSGDSRDRWPQHTAHYEEWERVKPGTRVLVTDVFRPQHLPTISHPRPDGLHEVVLKRIKVQRFEDGYGLQKHSYEMRTPVFVVPDDPKKRPARVFGEFAFADDPGMVAALVQFKARERANQELSHLFTTYATAAKKEIEQGRRKQAAEERRRMLAERAAAVGVTPEELAEGIDAWHTIRRRRYAPNKCLKCGRALTDPASIVRGVGPECLRFFPAIKAAARARVIDIGRMRFDGERLIERFKRAGVQELVEVVTEARAIEEIGDRA